MNDIMNNMAKDGWWNGINVLVKDTNNELLSIYPPSYRCRKLYENEHLIHTARLAEFAPNILNFVQCIARFNFYRAGKILARFIIDYASKRNDFKSRFEQMNTFSAELPGSQYAKFREGK